MTQRSASAPRLYRVNLSDIQPNPYQPRRTFSQASVAELAASIRQYGLISPISVRRNARGQLELIAGERRLRALEMLGEQTTDVILMSAYDEDCALMALIENIQRENLNCFEEAEAYRAAMREHGLSQEELAQRLGRSPSCIANRLRLLRLSEAVRSRILEAGLSERHARALLRLPDEDGRAQALSRMVTEQLSVRQSEELIDRMLKSQHAIRCPRVLYRDHRLLVNALLDTVRAMQQTGAGVTSRVTERDQFVEITVTVPRRVAGPGADNAAM